MDAPETAEPPRQRSGAGDRDDPPDRPRRDPLEFDLTDATGRLAGADALWLGRHADAAGERLGARGEVRVRIVGDAEMASAHERLMGVGGTTDVITSDLGGGAEALDADLLICLDEAGRQAAVRGHSAREELLLYIVHGLLHCLGYDDHDEREAERMHRMEDETLSAIGVGAVFARPGRGIGLPPDGKPTAAPGGHRWGPLSPGRAMPPGERP